MSFLKAKNKTLRESNINELSTFYKNEYRLQSHGNNEASIIFNPTAGTKLKEILLDAFELKKVTKKKIFVSWYSGLHEVPLFDSSNYRSVFSSFYEEIKS